jgi:hypothetical protein
MRQRSPISHFPTLLHTAHTQAHVRYGGGREPNRLHITPDFEVRTRHHIWRGRNGIHKRRLAKNKGHDPYKSVMRLKFGIVVRARLRVGVGESVCAGANDSCAETALEA